MDITQDGILNFIYGNIITSEPKRCKSTVSNTGNLAWVFTSKERVDFCACRTVKTLTRKIYDGDVNYITFSGFYRRDRRVRENVRQQLAIVLDFDSKNGGDKVWGNSILAPLYLMETCQNVGLPIPSIIWRTPSGIQAAWVLSDPLIYGKDGKSLGLGAGVAKALIKELGADPKALGAERWWRVPTPENVLYLGTKVAMAELVAWRDKCYPLKRSKRFNVYHLINWLHPDIQMLSQGVSVGLRDNSAYTLALVCKQDGYTSKETLDWLENWNLKNDIPLSSSQIRAKVRSAYRYDKRPGLAWLRKIDEKIPNTKTGRKNTKKLKTDHAIIFILKGRKGHKWTGSIQTLANRLNVPKRTVINALSRLQKKGFIFRLTTGKGRAAKTTIILSEVSMPFINGEKSTNTLEQVVGGAAFDINHGYMDKVSKGPSP